MQQASISRKCCRHRRLSPSVIANTVLRNTAIMRYLDTDAHGGFAITKPLARRRTFAACCLPPLLLLAALAGCDGLTDAATRLAYDIEAGVERLGREPGARHSIRHRPADAAECSGPYTIQLDKVGALIVWCKDGAGNTVASGSTSFHSRFVETPQTYIVEKDAGTTFVIEVERRNGKAIVIDAS